MSIKNTILAAAVSGVLGMGVAGTATADIYALSHLYLDALSLQISDDTGQQVGVNNFNFDLTNTASLNSNAVIDTNACSGTTLPFAGNCGGNAAGSGANTVLGGATDIATGAGAGANVVNAPGSVPLRTEDNYSFLGPNVGEYASADSVIYDAQLVGDALSRTENIAEALLLGGESASAGSTIQSTTAITFDFTILPGTSGNMVLSFLADPDLRALIDTPPVDDAATATAQADVTWRFNLTQDIGGNGEIQWSPQGSAANDCVVFGGSSAVCTETNDTQDLNNTVSVGALPFSEDLFSYDVANVTTAFGITISGIEAGDWSITLFEQKQVSLSQTRVPEPSILGLLGMSLFGLGFLKLRSKKRS